MVTKRIPQQSLVGKRIKLVNRWTNARSTQVVIGSEGTVLGVDPETGAVSVKWDDCVESTLMWDDGDRWQVLLT